MAAYGSGAGFQPGPTSDPDGPLWDLQIPQMVQDLPANAAGPPAPGRAGSWMRWAIPVAAFVVGTTLGSAGAGGDPTQYEEYQALEQALEAAESRIVAMSDRARDIHGAARVAQDEAAQRHTELDGRATELDQREAALVAREQAVTVVVQQAAAHSVGEGTWTVGVDIEPGTYRTAEPVGSSCSWSIYRSGSNGSDILDNGIPGGGFPEVTLQPGQDFVNNRCGTFVAQ